jgi:hypothetical protein
MLIRLNENFIKFLQQVLTMNSEIPICAYGIESEPDSDAARKRGMNAS